MTNKTSLVALILALIALLVVIARPVGHEVAAKHETAFERVTRSGTLRCAYIARAHHFTIDAATKQISGIDYEVMEAAAKLLHLKVDWVEETGYGAFPEQLQSGKEDALCVTVWTSTARAVRTLSTAPVIISPLYVFVREGDTRFDNHLEALNDEKYTLAVLDGATMKAVADTSFPKAKQFAASGLSADGEVLLNIVTGKGDAGFFDEIMVNDFNQNSPDKKLRRVSGVLPVRNYPETFSVAMGEWELREMLSVAIAELHNNGTIERILQKYETFPGEIARVVLPYVGQGKS